MLFCSAGAFKHEQNLNHSTVSQTGQAAKKEVPADSISTKLTNETASYRPQGPIAGGGVERKQQVIAPESGEVMKISVRDNRWDAVWGGSSSKFRGQ